MSDFSSLRILFFDGHCNLCNGLVEWLVRQDPQGRFHFASLQGETAQKALRIRSTTPNDAEVNFETVVYLRKNVQLEKSTAILSLLADLGRPWSLFQIFFFVPRFFRDYLYGLVAQNRYRLFGRRETCRRPAPDESARFLP